MTKFINEEALEKFSVSLFQGNWPFPWYDFDNFLYNDAFLDLYKNFPPLELFDYTEGYQRQFGQRSHDRYYLGYEYTIYKNEKAQQEGRGIVQHEQLPILWQEFIDEIKSCEIYRKTILKAMQCDDFYFRFNWHMGRSSNEVSPHVDADSKIGTHLCYFNVSSDWDPSWGGQLEIMGNKTTNKKNPEFSDFVTSIPIQITDNHSLLFKNTGNSWHGVQPLKCPEGKFRRLFNIIFEVKE